MITKNILGQNTDNSKGMTLHLPCKPGDIFWMIDTRRWDWSFEDQKIIKVFCMDYDIDPFAMKNNAVVFAEIDPNAKTERIDLSHCKSTNVVRFGDISKFVFADEKSATIALKNMSKEEFREMQSYLAECSLDYDKIDDYAELER